jgi:hypothetical protein
MHRHVDPNVLRRKNCSNVRHDCYPVMNHYPDLPYKSTDSQDLDHLIEAKSFCVPKAIEYRTDMASSMVSQGDRGS